MEPNADVDVIVRLFCFGDPKPHGILFQVGLLAPAGWAGGVAVFGRIPDTRKPPPKLFDSLGAAANVSVARELGVVAE